MKPVFRIIGILSALDFLRAIQAMRTIVMDRAPEGASQEEAISATKADPDVQAARARVMQELRLFVLADLIVIALLIWWVFG